VKLLVFVSLINKCAVENSKKANFASNEMVDLSLCDETRVQFFAQIDKDLLK